MSKDENLFKELPEDLRDKFLEIFKDVGNVEEFQNSKDKSFIDLIAVLFKTSLKFLQDKQKLRVFLNIVPDLILNYDNFIINWDSNRNMSGLFYGLFQGREEDSRQTIKICPG